jgi:phosphatidylserine/phosphatidylglycerophosphate/cardiolipin synthase-like enzyme
MGIAVTFLEQDGQDAASSAALLAEFLAAAQSTLHLAIYDFRLSDPLAAPVVAALRDRAAAGVEVRIAYDAGKPYRVIRQASADPAPPGTAHFIERIGGGIQAKPITGGPPPGPKLMHHKYIVRDGRTPAGAVWTGSSNFTDDSWEFEENNIVRIESPALCAYYENDFGELWTSGDIATTGAHDTGTVQVGSISVGVAFAPGDGRAIDHEIAHYIGTARRRLKLCSMLVTSGAILGALCDALHHRRVAEYGGVYDRTQMESVFDQWQDTPTAWKIPAFSQIAAGLVGKRSTPYQPGSRHDFMHNKIVVADDTVITGSYNFSNSATLNAENVLLIHDRELADRYSGYVEHLADRYRDNQAQGNPK